MPARLKEIEKINVQLKPETSSQEMPPGQSRFEVRDIIVDRIKRIAGNDSIKRIVPIQNEGDRKTQDIVFDMEDASYLVTVTYNNAMTEGWVSDLRKDPKKC
ncbi:hypothetical protein [Methanocella arvoryzae]|uniref:Uncharacterized protein n=1 Tax=Methanocella arvoryzae (strain DSM 22066 / NBRC 105507 / MRE50) TaxID=351160 RepID=Q0W8N6_METAR|nr:hypothetical protein [Methanocella arvoryzae]CAJ35257.1 hypothetical protein LRC276 [Methanocella arvoryzae MRE50]